MTITTTPEMGMMHLGPDVRSMYSAAAMVQLIEGACLRLMGRSVERSEQTTGYRMDVRHLSPTTIGSKVTARVRLREINGRRYVLGSGSSTATVARRSAKTCTSEP